jgi:hypothetical protein
MIYFIACEATNCVKIGFTAASAQTRLSALRTGSPFPLKVVAEIAGQRDAEAALHAVFAPLRMSGEWFSRTGKLDDMLSYLEHGSSLAAAIGDCVVGSLAFPWRDEAALNATAKPAMLRGWQYA